MPTKSQADTTSELLPLTQAVYSSGQQEPQERLPVRQLTQVSTWPTGALDKTVPAMAARTWEM